MSKQGLLFIVLAVLLAAVPLVMHNGVEFVGADDKAKGIISEINPNYQPWFSSVFEPTGEAETFLFSLQAALGAGFIGYFFGYRQGKKASRDKADKECYT
jgi:cobalt/nickel transport protein